jgi:predicted transcriptional regulator
MNTLDKEIEEAFFKHFNTHNDYPHVRRGSFREGYIAASSKLEGIKECADLADEINHKNIEKLEKAVEIMREALGIYADVNSYDRRECECVERAEGALKEVDEILGEK